MIIQIHGKNIDITDAIRSHIEKSCQKLKKIRFVDDNDFIHVEIKYYKEKKGRAVITYKARRIGKTFVATGDNNDLYVAITNARDKILSQIKRYKDEISKNS